MKLTLYYILVGLLFISCQDSANCFESAGNITQKEISVEFFDKIEVRNGVELILKQSDTQKVILESGSNLIEHVDGYVQNNTLYVEDKNSCNFTRDFGLTKVYVNSPNIVFINSKTEQNISSDGTLHYPKLEVKCLKEDDGTATGDVHLKLESEECNFHSNNVTNFHIEGSTIHLGVYYWAGTSRFDGSKMKAKNIDIFHRGHNDMILYPEELIQGNMYSNGNLILVNKPEQMNVVRNYTGQIIYQ
ncbi:MAG: DUF2807 domain-containing protein [Flavobacteriales bacterium]|nr:DUF2807 domain-containing protein [Flavobacteriales bacterium]